MATVTLFDELRSLSPYLFLHCLDGEGGCVLDVGQDDA